VSRPDVDAPDQAGFLLPDPNRTLARLLVAYECPEAAATFQMPRVPPDDAALNKAVERQEQTRVIARHWMRAAWSQERRLRRAEAKAAYALARAEVTVLRALKAGVEYECGPGRTPRGYDQ